MHSENYWPMLIPFTMSKLPKNITIIITPHLGKDLWGIKLILEASKKKLEVLEKADLTKSILKKEEGNFDMPSASNMFANNSPGKISASFAVKL